jgi:hypothetical protein
VSCKEISNEEFDNTIPVSPPKVNKKMNPKTHQKEGVFKNLLPYIVLNQLKTLIPVGTAIIMVAAVK